MLKEFIDSGCIKHGLFNSDVCLTRVSSSVSVCVSLNVACNSLLCCSCVVSPGVNPQGGGEAAARDPLVRSANCDAQINAPTTSVPAASSRIVAHR